MRRAPVIALCLLGLFTSLYAVPAGPTGEPLTLDCLREALENYSFGIGEAYFASDAYGAEIEIDELHEEYAWLYDAAIVEWIRELEAAADDPRAARGLNYLAKDLEGVLLWEPLESAYIEILMTEITGTIEFRGETIAYRDVWSRADQLEDDAEREELRDLARAFILEELHPLEADYRLAVRRRCQELGYSDYVDYYQRTRGRSFAHLVADCLYILAETRDLYIRLADERVAEVYPGRERLSLSSIERWRLWDDDEYDDYFTGEELMPVWEAFIDGLEVDFAGLTNITLDIEDRPEKEPRASCWPLRVPEDIRVLVKPTGGFNDYSGLFHEMGHACHFAYTDPALEYEYRNLGDDAITEAYAFVFENVFVNPVYLAEAIGMSEEDSRRFRRQQLFSEVAGLRYYCVTFLYELLFHGLETDPADAYASLIGMTTIWSHAPDDLLTGVYGTDEGFYSTNYLYAWMLEAQLRARLVEDYGEDWWRSPAAGQTLRKLWSRGYEPLPRQLSLELGYTDCDPVALLSQIQRLEAETRP